MACSSGGNMSTEDVVVTQWLDPSQQNKVEHNNSNLVLFERQKRWKCWNHYKTFSKIRSFLSLSCNVDFLIFWFLFSDFHGAPSSAEHLDPAPPRNIPSPHLDGGESFYPHSSSHAPSPPLPLQYTQFTTDAFSSSDVSFMHMILLSSEQCAEMLKSGVKLELVLPNGSLAYGVMEPVTKSINVQVIY
ncbi:hypothetical protein WDU94_014491 [Cyamophila willieti]